MVEDWSCSPLARPALTSEGALQLPPAFSSWILLPFSLYLGYIKIKEEKKTCIFYSRFLTQVSQFFCLFCLRLLDLWGGEISPVSSAVNMFGSPLSFDPGAFFLSCHQVANGPVVFGYSHKKKGGWGLLSSGSSARPWSIKCLATRSTPQLQNKFAKDFGLQSTSNAPFPKIFTACARGAQICTSYALGCRRHLFFTRARVLYNWGQVGTSTEWGGGLRSWQSGLYHSRLQGGWTDRGLHPAVFPPLLLNRPASRSTWSARFLLAWIFFLKKTPHFRNHSKIVIRSVHPLESEVVQFSLPLQDYNRLVLEATCLDQAKVITKSLHCF